MTLRSERLPGNYRQSPSSFSKDVAVEVASRASNGDRDTCPDGFSGECVLRHRKLDILKLQVLLFLIKRGFVHCFFQSEVHRHEAGLKTTNVSRPTSTST